MRRSGLLLLAVCLLTLLPLSHSSAAQEFRPKQRSGLGYCAGLGSIWMLGLNLKLGVSPRAAVETTLGLAFDGVLDDDPRAFHVAGVDLSWGIAKNERIDLTCSAGVWGLIGGKPPVDIFNPHGTTYGFGRFGLGSEAWNGYFIDLSYIGPADISGVMFKGGYRFY